MRKWIAAAALSAAASGCSAGKDKAGAETGVARFHQMLDAGRYHDIYVGASDEFRRSGSEQAATRFLAVIHERLGAVRRADQQAWRVNFRTGGNMVAFHYSTEFESGRGTEDFVFQMRGGSPRLVGYHINSMDLIAPAPPQAGAQ